MIANGVRWDIGWEALIAIVVIVLCLTLLGLVVIWRDPRRHHWRIGFFVEREDERSDKEPWPDYEQTAELPSSVRREEEK